MYSIYKVTSPSGKSYVGLTKNPVKERWAQHVKRAFHERRKHPFYQAIRKYGPDKFKIETIDYALSKSEAQQLEQLYIAEMAPNLKYNLSKGGEADGEDGARIFWGSIKQHPQELAAYRKKLSDTKKQRDWTNYDALTEKAKQWRKDNPRKAYKMAHRALRMANKKAHCRGPKKVKKEQPLKDKLLWRYKRSVKTRENALALWARRSEEDRAEIGRKISEAVKERWGTVTDTKQRSQLTEAARTTIDRKKQGAAASKGLKHFWEELKKDPERYNAYVAQRKATLLKTLQEKKK